jgi:hypothetical protein
MTERWQLDGELLRFDGELLPCPFCGGPAAIRRAGFGRDEGYVVGCSHDAAADPEMCDIAPWSLPFVSPEAAAAAWNRRSNP